MNKSITWSILQKEKARKELKKLILAWLGLIITGLVITPILWIFMVLLLSV